jgi:hypothetical protein
VEWCASIVSTSARLGGMAHWGFGDRRSVMDSHRSGAPPGTVVPLMASLVRGFDSV